MVRQSDRDAAALAAQRERDRQLAIAYTSDLCNYVVEMADAGRPARRRAGVVPIVPGGRLWLAVKLYFDHPDVFADARRGEYTSITAAARQAGVVRPRRRLTLGRDPGKWARSLFAAVSREELHAAAVLNDLEERRDDPDSRRARRLRDAELAGERIERIIAPRRKRR